MMAETQYVAFLRAINVGGRIVKMTDLKRIFEAIGCSEVSTFIASGNVIFTSKRAVTTIEHQIEQRLQQSLGYPVTTVVRTTAEVARVAAHAAFAAADIAEASIYVGFMRHEPSLPGVARAMSLQTTTDLLHVHGREIYWLARKNIAAATITGAAIEKALETAVTLRNINTVRRLAAKYPPLP